MAKEEVRIFPLIDLEGKRSSQVDEVIHLVQNRGCDVQEKEVPYEFMRGGLDRIKAAFFICVNCKIYKSKKIRTIPVNIRM
ncbi:hypothetical protein PAV_1c11080 [Paenibacillus alvei DSM 29]|uniref:hypothetical protein n=1 Tax=Paenibacillus alvei TaxID=44250 RepID=UPI000288FE3E|nr:hypothetical protein [Paenibacillus alvei]EJW20110.1 hypothetical protein PAV_1c11080 [Paenibacillus alvei DSM 29]